MVAFESQQFFIPFLFTLAIVFGVLELTPIFQNRPVKVVIAVAMAFFAATYEPFTTILWSYLPTVTWFFIAMFFVAFLAEMFGMRKRSSEPLLTIISQSFIFFVLLSVGWMVKDIFTFDIPVIGGPDNVLFIVGLGFILSIFWKAYYIGLTTGGGEKKGK